MAVNEDFPLALCSGTVLAGQYVIEKVLGQGGFGITYKASNHKTGEKVAVKEFFPDSLAYRESTQVISYPGERDENFQYGKESFLQEAQTLAQFIGNKNIVHIHSYFEENGTAYFVMDYIEGTSFDEYLRQNDGKISVIETEKILIPIMDALEAVHAKGIVHRDVTPDNIYICSDGTVKLLDFGAARYSLGDKSKSLDIILKHGFAPKEQYTRHGRQGPYTDIYSLAATFYFAITGRRPPDSIDRLDEDDLIPPSSLGIDITDYQEKALYMALEVQPQDRFSSMAVFKKVLLNENPVQTQTITGYANAPVTAVGSTVSSVTNNGAGTTVSTSGGTGNADTPPAPKQRKISGRMIAVASAAVAVFALGVGTAVLAPSFNKRNDNSGRRKDRDNSNDAVVDAFIEDSNESIPDETKPPKSSETAPAATSKIPDVTTAAPEPSPTDPPPAIKDDEVDPLSALGASPDEALKILERGLGVSLPYYADDSFIRDGVELFEEKYYTSKTDSAVPFWGIDFNSVLIEYSDDNVVHLISFYYSDLSDYLQENSRPYTYHSGYECNTMCDILYESFFEVYGEPTEQSMDHEEYKDYADYGWWSWRIDNTLVTITGGENLWGYDGNNDVTLTFTDITLHPFL